MKNSVNLCVVGAGAIAQRHMLAFAQQGGVNFTWVVSHPSAQAREFAQQYGFQNSGEALEPALTDPNVNLVLISSPSPLHATQAIQALQAGKDVIAEIPVALTWPEAQQVAHTAHSLGRRVWVCHTLRSTPALQLVRERVQSGQLNLTQINGFFGIPRRRNQGMGGTTIRTWIDNLLWHHGCHQIDASLWVLKMPPVWRVQAQFGPPHPIFGMALDVGVQLVTASGTLITHSLSYNVEHGHWGLQFIGHEDVLKFEDGRLTSEIGGELIPSTPVSDLAAQDQAILADFRDRCGCEFTLSNVLATMQVLALAQHSADVKSVNP